MENDKKPSIKFEEIADKELFLAMNYLFIGGDFPNWLSQQNLPLGAAKEWEEAKAFFEKKTGVKS